MKPHSLITLILGIILALLGAVALLFGGNVGGVILLLIGVSLCYLGWRGGRKALIVFGHTCIVVGCILITWGIYLLPYSKPTLLHVFTRPLFWGLFCLLGGICLEFYDAFLNYAKRLRKKRKKLIICGDVNTAHTEIDLARPKQNQKTSGFLPEERTWIDKFLAHGFTDTFRVFNKEGGNYTWWDYKSRARQRNIGWRLDYFFISENLQKHLKSAFIISDVHGSDHCPLGIDIEI